MTSWILYCGEVSEVEVTGPAFTDSDVTHIIQREEEVTEQIIYTI